MKKVLLSADGNISVFAVPDKVADNLRQYCLEFCCEWLYKSPDAAGYRVEMNGVTGVCYTEKDFIAWLNKYICEEESILITTLDDVYVGDRLPGEYVGLPYFNF